jgi:hypothetical protein
MTIDDIKIGDSVLDRGVVEKVTDKTTNTVEVTRTARSDKGINCKQWFSFNDFQKLFKLV